MESVSSIVEQYKINPKSVFGNNGPSFGTNANVPDLKGLLPNQGRTLKEGPFKGQTWANDANGNPYRVTN
jgi:hypothetical protein